MANIETGVGPRSGRIDTYVHELHIGFGACSLVEDFNSNGNLHRLTFGNPDALKCTSNHHKCAAVSINMSTLGP